MSTDNLLIIGSSTGGPKILEELLPRLHVLRTAVLIVQHITAYIDKAFVSSLGRVSPMPVHLAAEGDLLQNGHVYVAPGGIHLLLVNNQRVHLKASEPVNSVRPSIDVAMTSLGKPSGRLVGVILTGMGRDGAEGIKHMKPLGAVTIAQDQATSVIYGMPKAAAETGCVDFILSTQRIADKLRELF
jgi:two-component system chemotaxis response regulator CheB